MMRIRILTIILLGALVVGALAGCQAKESPSADQTVITFAYPEYLTAFNKAN